jgi:hypothetical protein
MIVIVTKYPRFFKVEINFYQISLNTLYLIVEYFIIDQNEIIQLRNEPSTNIVSIYLLAILLFFMIISLYQVSVLIININYFNKVIVYMGFFIALISNIDEIFL